MRASLVSLTGKRKENLGVRPTPNRTGMPCAQVIGSSAKLRFDVADVLTKSSELADSSRRALSVTRSRAIPASTGTQPP